LAVLAIILLESPFFALLFFINSVSAMLLLPTRQGLAWIGLFTLITAGAYISTEGLAGGLLSALVNGAAFIFFGMFGQALVRAEAARQESQRLLGELQKVHRQLQTYTDQVETLAVAEERNRLSRDLHDTLGHRLTASIVQLEGAERLLDGNPERARQIVSTVREQLNEGLNEVRRTVAMLRAPLTTDLSLPKALNQLAAGFAEATSLQVQTAIPDTLPPLPDGHRLALYRATQEALTNIQRHAHAQTVWLSLKQSGGMLTLCVSDDGIGLPPEILSGANGRADFGLGLRGMQERADQLGGQVDLAPRPGGGTDLLFQLPTPSNHQISINLPEPADEPAFADPSPAG
jgi:signal transduction histidine kinase